MKLMQHIEPVIPSFIIKKIRLKREFNRLDTAQRIEYKTDNVRSKNDLSLNEIFSSHDINGMWFDSEKDFNQFNIPDGTGGVNLGDRRVLYYLISAIKPKSVLEIGTHIGASTIHIASALHKNSDKNATITTIDITDVNSNIEKPWVKFGTTHSPIEMIYKLGYGSFVDFITDTSFNYLANCQSRFDFIFLDGDHSATTVYQEIPLALNLLNQNGVILLHDYFPKMKSLWSNNSIIPGPFLATEKLIKEGGNITVIPLGKLPWPTKLESHVTSLALLLRNS